MTSASPSGLADFSAPSSSLAPVQWGIAAGTPDAITVAYSTPNTVLFDGLLLAFRALGANTTTTPTFSPDGLQPYPIVKKNLIALAASDIAGGGMDILVRFNLANLCWCWVNR